MNARLVLYLALSTAPVFAAVGVITEDFTTSRVDSSSTGVWNAVTHTLEVPYVVLGMESTPFDIGTGADGAFDATTQANFDLNANAVPTVVTLNSDRVYQFTSFTLPAGVTLRAQGSAALRIRVQGDVQIDGTVDLRGGNGGASFNPATATHTGGTACCSGGAGGTGVSTLMSPGTGTTPIAGGAGGSGANSGAGGTPGTSGGGGANDVAGNAAAGGGAGGTRYADSTLSVLVGGAGGGGGAGNSTIGGAGSAGGGGGGGGGALGFFVGGDFSVSATGSVLTDGGNGGAGSVPNLAGGGGGGAGGSVLIYAGGTGTDDGLISSQGGTGGAATTNGGGGGLGMHRFAFPAGQFGGSGTENPNPGPGLTSFRSILSHTIISQSYDTENPSPRYTGFTKTETLQTGDTATYEIAGSHDAFVSSDSGYVSAANVTQLNGYRYIRFRVTLQSASAATSPKVTGLSVSFEPRFAFSLAGCARVAQPTGAAWGWLALLAYLLALKGLARRSWAGNRPTRKLPTH